MNIIRVSSMGQISRLTSLVGIEKYVLWIVKYMDFSPVACEHDEGDSTRRTIDTIGYSILVPFNAIGVQHNHLQWYLLKEPNPICHDFVKHKWQTTPISHNFQERPLLIYLSPPQKNDTWPQQLGRNHRFHLTSKNLNSHQVVTSISAVSPSTSAVLGEARKRSKSVTSSKRSTPPTAELPAVPPAGWDGIGGQPVDLDENYDDLKRENGHKLPAFGKNTGRLQPVSQTKTSRTSRNKRFSNVILAYFWIVLINNTEIEYMLGP